MDRNRELEIDANLTLFLAENTKTRQEKLYLCFLLAITARNGLLSILGKRKTYESLCRINDEVIK